jgi:hypothetical protein
MSIFKGKKEKGFKQFRDSFYTQNKTAWNTTEILVYHLKLIIPDLIKANPNRPLCLVMDSFSAHKKFEVVNYLNEQSVKLLLIPPGCTSVLQPLDTHLNASLKDYLRNRNSEYVDALFRKEKLVEQIPSPSPFVVLDWLLDFQKYFISKQIIPNAFKYCCMNVNYDELHMINPKITSKLELNSYFEKLGEAEYSNIEGLTELLQSCQMEDLGGFLIDQLNDDRQPENIEDILSSEPSEHHESDDSDDQDDKFDLDKIHTGDQPNEKIKTDKMKIDSNINCTKVPLQKSLDDFVFKKK